MSFIERILDIPADVANPWAYWLILFISLCEPIPLVGAFVPGQILLLLAGVMVKRGVLDFGDAVAFATIGAILGDLANFGLGKKYGEAILVKYGRHVFLKPERMDKVKDVLLKYTGRTLILGRFSSVTRWAAPFLSGSMGISFFKFMNYNVVGGLGWSLALVSLGWFFGEGVEIASRHLGRYILVTFFLCALMILMVKWKSKGKPVFHPNHRYVLIMNILSLALVSKIIEDVLTGKWVIGWDFEIRDRVVEYWSPAMESFMKRVYVATCPWVCAGVGLATAIGFLARRKCYLAWFLATGMGGGVNILLMTLAAGSGIWLNLHWASDVIGGMMLGLFWLTLLILIYKNFIPGFRDVVGASPDARL